MPVCCNKSESHERMGAEVIYSGWVVTCRNTLMTKLSTSSSQVLTHSLDHQYQITYIQNDGEYKLQVVNTKSGHICVDVENAKTAVQKAGRVNVSGTSMKIYVMHKNCERSIVEVEISKTSVIKKESQKLERLRKSASRPFSLLSTNKEGDRPASSQSWKEAPYTVTLTGTDIYNGSSSNSLTQNVYLHFDETKHVKIIGVRTEEELCTLNYKNSFTQSAPVSSRQKPSETTLQSGYKAVLSDKKMQRDESTEIVGGGYSGGKSYKLPSLIIVPENIKKACIKLSGRTIDSNRSADIEKLLKIDDPIERE